LRIVRVKPDVAKGASLAQEVPALIQFNLDLREPPTIGFGVCPQLVQSVFLCHEVLNMIEDRLIFDLILHKSLHHANVIGTIRLWWYAHSKLRPTDALTNTMHPA
jgi:hypothetical protein